MRPAQLDEIIATGAVAGYGSPIGVKNALVVVDDLIPQSPNLVAGANETGFHFLLDGLGLVFLNGDFWRMAALPR